MTAAHEWERVGVSQMASSAQRRANCSTARIHLVLKNEISVVAAGPFRVVMVQVAEVEVSLEKPCVREGFRVSA